MYPNLRAEMARAGLTITNLAQLMDVSIPTLSNKLNGKKDFSLKDAFKIKKILRTDVSIDELFKKEER